MSKRIDASHVLVCFAVTQEAQPFRKQTEGRPRINILVTGMGRRNAEAAVREELKRGRPGMILSCGFAGGLDPRLAAGTVLYAEDGLTGLETALLAVGARSARFHCVDRVATTAVEKRALRERTGADAVEMESEAIAAICRAQGIPFATVRVILDAANDDLPLDFNKLMTSRQEMSYGKLAGTLVRSPGKIKHLLKFQKETQAAAETLARVLLKITA